MIYGYFTLFLTRIRKWILDHDFTPQNSFWWKFISIKWFHQIIILTTHVIIFQSHRGARFYVYMQSLALFIMNTPILVCAMFLQPHWLWILCPQYISFNFYYFSWGPISSGFKDDLTNNIENDYFLDSWTMHSTILHFFCWQLWGK